MMIFVTLSVGKCQCSFNGELLCTIILILLDGCCEFPLNFFTMLCYKFEFVIIFESFDIFQYLFEINKIDTKPIKIDRFHY